MHSWRRAFVISAVVCVVAFCVGLTCDAAGSGSSTLELVGILFNLLGAVALPMTAVLGIFTWWGSGGSEHPHQTDVPIVHPEGLDEARRITALLVAGEELPALTLWGVVLHPGEKAHFDVQLTYARRGSTRAPADRRWYERQTSRVIATDRRFICHANGKWLSFYFQGVTAFYPEPDDHSIVMEFGDGVPLSLFGPDAPALAAYATLRVHGVEALRTHPALRTLHPAP